MPDAEYKGQPTESCRYCYWEFDFYCEYGIFGVSITAYTDRDARPNSWCQTGRRIHQNVIQWENDEHWVSKEAKDFIERVLKLKVFL